MSDPIHQHRMRARIDAMQAGIAQLKAERDAFAQAATEAQAERDAARDERDALLKDAERFRWLRQFRVDSYMASGSFADLDAAIDKAMASSSKGDHGMC